MKQILGFLIVFSVLSCAHKPLSIMAPDGKLAIPVVCKAYKTECFKKANKICKGSPYKIIDDSSSSTGFGSFGGNVGITSTNGTYSLLIRCEEKPAENIAESKK